MPEGIKHFRQLFEGNTKFYGTEQGGCIEASASWSSMAEWHLTGAISPIGVYPMHKYDMDNCVGWGCIDFDEGEDQSRLHALDVHNCLNEFYIKSWIERSRSKGYHVWVFTLDVIAARSMRDALLAACQIVDAPTKEINPKQYKLAPGKIGNYVRLPYPGALVGGDQAYYGPDSRRVMIDPDTGFHIGLEQFALEAIQHKTSSEWIDKLANLYVPPKSYVAPDRNDRDPLEGDAVERLSGLAKHIFSEGPRDDQPVTDKDYDNGRSSRLWKLARLICEGGNHEFDEAIELVADADSRWGKFHDRGEDNYIATMVAKAWGLDV